MKRLKTRKVELLERVKSDELQLSFEQWKASMQRSNDMGEEYVEKDENQL